MYKIGQIESDEVLIGITGVFGSKEGQTLVLVIEVYRGFGFIWIRMNFGSKY